MANDELITLDMLNAVDPNGSEQYHREILPYLNKCARAYRVNTHNRIAHFLSQIEVESGFKVAEEDLNYTAKQMKKIFGCKYPPHGSHGARYAESGNEIVCNFGRLRDKLWSSEEYYAHNAERLGNYVYANRMGNGDENSGDGYKYRGRGLIQMTGKSAYQDFTSIHNQKFPGDHQDFVSKPDLIISNLEYSIESAFVIWEIKSLNRHVDENGSSVSSITKIVNGGQNGVHDRQAAYNRLAPMLDLPRDQ